MTTFKKGDKFIPRKPKENAENQGWLIYMDKYEGKTLAVAKISGDGWLMDEVTEWFYNPNWCEKVEDNHISDAPKTIDWNYWRNEFAKTFTAAIIAGNYKELSSNVGIPPNVEVVRYGIGYADEMIKQLKGE